MMDMDHVYKGYKIEGDGTFGYFRIRAKAQGQSPRALGGDFTTRPLAMRAIDAFVDSKGKTNAKTKATS